MVNERKQVAATGSAIVTFMGAEGSSVAVEVPKDAYILDAGLEAGLELPYTCRGGICGACVGRVASGSVDMSDIDDLSFTIDEEEQAKGMALICMARPVEDCVIETQSDWGYSLGVGEWKGPTGHILGKEIDPLTQGM
jgi:2Fe-2S type ferredoxin